MAIYINTRSCPEFIVSHVRLCLRSEDVAYRKRTNWIKALFERTEEKRFNEFYEVRWLSRFVPETLACTGALLGRWIVGMSVIKPLDFDFAEDGPKESFGEAAIYNYWHPILLDFAVDCEESACVLSRIGREGDISNCKRKLPSGMSSMQIGDLIGRVIERKIERSPGDQCAPAGWSL